MKISDYIHGCIDTGNFQFGKFSEVTVFMMDTSELFQSPKDVELEVYIKHFITDRVSRFLSKNPVIRHKLSNINLGQELFITRQLELSIARHIVGEEQKITNYSGNLLGEKKVYLSEGKKREWGRKFIGEGVDPTTTNKAKVRALMVTVGREIVRAVHSYEVERYLPIIVDNAIRN